ncbi:UDP-3-O-(3-hydroxymyristoyl)glucosamine N-acyltransferase [Salidesulfovibrio onnuriiensis]|uniref:UDP-3-O-(3-hydroxymyristoyl)glucosamine N-acyltransferase n=1 Tax=Salidesulfovibrio onnuriiensis TaxID=2583823 RepID=UPI0011CC5BC4|nr:UDP-3-O-(3-hydroxymyristoyl)glucosamine N-acyltransferase [Salidesulfovibrio onnuriiensis]
MSQMLSSIAKQLGLEYTGNDIEITGVNTLEKACPGELSFLVNPKYSDLLATTQASCIITDSTHAASVECALVSSNVYMDLARVVKLFETPQGCLTKSSSLAYVHETARLAESAVIYPFAFIGPEASIGEGSVVFPGCYVGEGSVIGDDCILYPNVVIMGGVRIDDNVIVQPGAVIGADGYGYAQTPFGHMKIPQIGTVSIETNVEIGANTAVDRAALDVTRVGRGTKIDNLVQIGHNVQVGENCLLVGQVGIGGSTEIGDNVILGGQVGVADNVKIGSNTMAGAQSGISGVVPEGSKIGGSPSMPYSTFLKAMGVCAPKLPDLFKRMKKIEKQLANLQESMGDKNE